ncbi:Sir2-like protein [Serratia phage Slocum]|nr:Sir2-like protein [Serratia phage Slocum]
MRRLIVVSGAGLSAGSGIRTFRTDTDSGKALWDEYDLDEVCNIRAFNGNFYSKTHAFYNKRRAELETVQPNMAHMRIAEWYQRFPGQVLNLTTNVDDLLERAGVHGGITHIHGELTKLLVHEKDAPKFEHVTPQQFYGMYGGIVDIGYQQIDVDQFHFVKPYVTFFGEASDKYQEMYNILDTLTTQDLVLLVGSSNQVINFYWELFPAFNMGTKMAVINPVIDLNARYQMENGGIPYFMQKAEDVFCDPRFIEMVEKHLEG